MFKQGYTFNLLSFVAVGLLVLLNACGSSTEQAPVEKDFRVSPEATGAQFVWPVSGWISATDHYWNGTDHTSGSADIAAPYWQPVGAARDGTVVEAGWSVSPRLGNFVRIGHGNGYETVYAHLVEAPLVEAGDAVRKNQRLGYSGRTGNATVPHVHFAISRDGEAQKIPEIGFGSWVNKGASIPGDYPSLTQLSSSTASFTVKVIEDKLPVFSSASANSSVLGTLAVGATWTVTGGSSGFYRVTYGGSSGYIANSGVVPSNSKLFGIRTTTFVSARSGPGSNYTVMTTFPSGTTLNAFKTRNGYHKTQWRDANRFVRYVWVSASAATTTSRFWMQATLSPKVYLRSGPGTNYPVVQTLAFDAYKPEYLVTDNVRGWYKVGPDRWFPGWQTLRR